MKNEPAFPFLFPAGENNEIFGAHVGLSKREIFAAMAMQGLLAGHYDINDVLTDRPFNLSYFAVKHADALIAELSKSEGGEE